MNRRTGFRIVIGLLLLVAAAGIGLYGYNVGVAHGLAQAGSAAGAPPPWGYWRPWGFGFFPFFPIFPILFFVLFWVILSRALFWRGGRWGGGCCHEAHPGRGRRAENL